LREYTYLDIDVVLVDICEDTVLAIMSLVTPYFASIVGPGPVLGLLVVIPVIVLPVVIIRVVSVPVVARLDGFDLVVRSESVGWLAAVL
jgi:hypothetical protein